MLVMQLCYHLSHTSVLFALVTLEIHSFIVQAGLDLDPIVAVMTGVHHHTQPFLLRWGLVIVFPWAAGLSLS
jgi:hypothetical protein